MGGGVMLGSVTWAAWRVGTANVRNCGAGAIVAGMVNGQPPALSTPPLVTELANPLGGSRNHYSWRGHDIAYSQRGDGPPMLLVHSAHACAWSMEWRNIVPALSTQFTTYSIDLLGFGASAHPLIHYTGQLYVDLIRDFLADVIRTPAILVGSSLGGTYAVAVAAKNPSLVRAVSAIGPAGVSRLYNPGGTVNAAVESLFRTPRFGKALFSALVSKPSIRFFLKGIYHDHKHMLTADVVNLFWTSAQQHNARLAPAAFVGMKLNYDIRHALGTMPVPFMLAWGQFASQTPFREAKTVQAVRPEAQFSVFPCGDLPHEEEPDAFLAALLQFVGTLD